MKKITLFLFLTSMSFVALAQNKQQGMRWGGGIDYQRFNWGFSFHSVASSFKVFKNSNWQDENLPINSEHKLSSITSPKTYGWGVGLVTDLKLNEHTYLRFNPNVLFTDKQVNFNKSVDVTDGDGTERTVTKSYFTKEVIASLLELPLTFRYTSERRKNYAVYLLAGGKYSRNIAPKEKLNNAKLPFNEKIIKLQPGFFSYEAGLGLDVYFSWFKMSPEIKWSQSVGNVLDKTESTMFNEPIDKLLLRSIQFSLIFE